MAINGRFVCPGDELNTKKEAKSRRNAKEPSNIGLELGIIQQRWSTWAKQEMDRPQCPTATASAGPGSSNAARATHTDINGGIIRDATNGSDSISMALFVVVLGFFRFALARSLARLVPLYATAVAVFMGLWPCPPPVTVSARINLELTRMESGE